MASLRSSQKSISKRDKLRDSQGESTSPSPEDPSLQSSVGGDRARIFWYCDACGALVPGDGHYKCWDCEDYDLCASCYDANRHSQHALFKESPDMAYHSSCVKESLSSSIWYTMDIYRDRPCLGTRIRREDGSVTNEYSWMTYGQCKTAFVEFGSGMLEHLSPKEFVGICGINTARWLLTDYACFTYQLVSVPIHTTFDQRATEHVINNAELSCVVSSKKEMHKFISAVPKCPSLRLLIQMDPREECDEPPCLPPSVHFYYWEDVRRVGRGIPRAGVPFQPDSPDQLICLTYTSGSTGFPKGAMTTDRIFTTDITSNYKAPDPFVKMAHGPFAHSERVGVLLALVKGARVGVFDQDNAQLFDAIQALRPTIFSTVPRVYNQLWSEFQNAAAIACAGMEDRQKIFDTRKALMKDLKGVLGGRMKCLISGGAPISPAVVKWLKWCFECPVYEGYGCTECGPITTDGYIHHDVEVKLVDVPDMEYFSTDYPYARGEICVKSDLVIPGYYRNPEATASALDDEGYFRTGDIGQRLPNGKIQIIDRKKSIFKLAQGEYVAPERLENSYIRSEYIDQVFIHGDSMRSFVTAVVVPNFDVVIEWAKSHGLCCRGAKEDPHVDKERLCSDVEVMKAILQDMVKIAKGNEFCPWEIPKGLVLTMEEFTPENGCMTPSNKLSRRGTYHRHKEALDALYVDLEQSERNTLAMVEQAMNEALGDADGAEQGSFLDRGGDSMAAMQLVATIRKRFGVHLDVESLYGVGATATNLAGAIATGDGSLHLEKKKKIDWARESYLSMDVRPSDPIAVPDGAGEGGSGGGDDQEVILLTGCTGFLGVFLLLEILSQFSEDAKVICLVRAKDEEAALHRIRKALAFASGDLRIRDDDDDGEPLTCAMDESSNRSSSCWKFPSHLDVERCVMRIEPLCGDLRLPRWGLSETRWSALEDCVTHIYHAGAHVNGVLPYSALRGTNVDGTTEALRLACACGPGGAVFHHISTLSVFPANGVEDADLMESSHVMDFMGGYAQSKWVAENKVKAAQDRGLRCTIYRPGTIGGDSSTGASNQSDFVFRVICGMAQMQKYPPVKGIVNIVPVDFAARAVVHISQQTKSLGRVFHIANVDNTYTVTDVIEHLLSFGIPMESTSSYLEWRGMLSCAGSENVLTPLIGSFSNTDPNGFPVSEQMDNHMENTIEALEGSSIQCPPMSESIMHAYLRWFRSQGFLN